MKITIFSSIYGVPGFKPISGSRRAEGSDPLTEVVEEVLEKIQKRNEIERRALYGVKSFSEAVLARVSQLK
mgnify:CR=1 FL=1